MLVTLAELLESGHEPRRLTEDLLTTCRDAFVAVAAEGRVQVDAPAEERDRLVALAGSFGNVRLIRTLETLGEAVVDMRGADAADPRLVLEIALVRSTRRDAGPPLAALADRVERLERQLAAGGVTEPRGAAASATDATPPRVAPTRTVGALRREAATRTTADAASTPASAPATTPEVDEPAAPEPTVGQAAMPEGPVDIDDVIVAWAAILPGLPVATRSAVQEAQPVSVDGDVITFGIPPQIIQAAEPRFKREADTIREALSARLGRRMRFVVKPNRFEGPPPGEAGPGDHSGGPPDDEPDIVDLTETVDAPDGEGPVDSVGIFAERFDAVVVEEVPRD